MSGITTNLATLENVRVVDEKPADLKQYGLAEPRVDVGFKAGADKDFRHLLVGDKTATGGDLYAKVGSDEGVFLIAGLPREHLQPDDVRPARQDASSPSIATRSTASRSTPAGSTLRLSLASGEWSLAEPIQAPADFGAVESWSAGCSRRR